MNRRTAPWIGITTDLSETPSGNANPPEPTFFLPRRYCRAVEAAGGVPVLLPPIAATVRLHQWVTRLDGLLISGGDFDIHPRFYGERPIRQLGKLKPERTEFELELTGIAFARDLPLLGVCGGAQAINVALGGALYQDIVAQFPKACEHQQGAKKHIGGHRVQIEPGTRLRRIVKQRQLVVNTTHHQAVKSLGRGLVVNATAEDGLVEGIESADRSFILGVQWHPEVLSPRFAAQRKIFDALIAACKGWRPKN